VSKELLKKAAEGSMKKDLPSFRVGDTVEVLVRIVEGDKERTQPFRGTVIRRQRSGVSETFTVRRIVNNEGVERTFPMHSPNLVDVKVVRSGRTRRAKLYYLRQRVGRATRLRDLAAEGGGASRASPAEGVEEGEAAEGPDEESPEDKE
jgi:large subunit ribosomal protein L19